MAERPKDIMRKRQNASSPPGAGAKRSVGQGTSPASLDDLKVLLEQLVFLAERQTTFTATVAIDWLLTALESGGYAFPIIVNLEFTLAPGATVTTYLPAPNGYVLLGRFSEHWSSLPWWVSAAAWVDYDVPALPINAVVSFPGHYTFEWPHFTGINRFIRYTIINNHATDTAHFIVTMFLYLMTKDVGDMIVKLYLSPLIDYVRANAEQVTGRPFP